MNRIEAADEYHERGCNCAQSVLSAFREDFGLDEETALRIAAGFGAGMGRMCQTCGALTGGYMVIGLKHGQFPAGKETTYSKVVELARLFEQRNGSTLCRELIGFELLDPEQRKKANETGAFERCGQYIRDAVELLEKVLID